MAFRDRLRAFLQPTPPTPMGELAIADTRRWTTTQFISRLQPYNPDLLARSKGGVKIYDDMRLDPQVKACLWLTKAAITGPGWKLEPVGDAAEEVTLAETLTNDLQTLAPFGFDDALSELLSAMAYGFAVNEKVYGISDEGRLHLTGLKGKAPHDIEFDADPMGNLLSIQQRQSQLVDLDPARFVWFAIEPEWGNFYGRSMLRPAYWPWWAKTHVRQWWAIYAEKFAIPAVVGKHPPTERDEAKISKVRDILAKLQAATAFTVPGGENGWEIQLLEASKDPSVFQTLLDWCNLEISRAILLPDKSGYSGAEIKGGSYSLAKTQFDLYLFVLTEHRTRLQRAIQQQLIDEMAELESPGIEPPRFEFLPLDDENMEVVAKIWIEAVTNGAVLAELEDENHLRRILKFPERTVANGMPDVPPATDTHLNPPEPAPMPGNGNGRKVEASEKGFWRALTLSERRADMAEKRALFDASTDKLGLELSAAIGDLIADLKKKAKRMPKASAAVRNLTPSATALRAVRTAVDAALHLAYDRSSRLAVGEVRRIKKNLTEDETRRLDMAARGGLIGSRAQAFFRDKSIYVTGLIRDDILKRAQQVLFNALKQDKTPGQVSFELDAALGDWLPETDNAGRVVNVPHRVETIARTNIAEAVSEARWATFADPDLEGFINAVRYSAVLDDRTRETHAAWDGVTLPMDHPAWFGPPDNRPPNGFSCRCLLVPIGAADADELTDEADIPTEPAADEKFK